MTLNVFVLNSLSKRELIKRSNTFLESNSKTKKRTVFSPRDKNFVISLFDKRIKITLVDNFYNASDIKYIQKYLETTLDNSDIIVQGDLNLLPKNNK